MQRKSLGGADPQLVDAGNDPQRNPYSTVAPYDESGSNLSAQSENESESESNYEANDKVMEDTSKNKPI